METEVSAVEEYLARWLCGDDADVPTYVVLTLPKNGEPQLTYRTKDKPRSKAEMEALPVPEIGCWTYDRGDAPLPMWQAFIVQAREDTGMTVESMDRAVLLGAKAAVGGTSMTAMPSMGFGAGS